MRGEDRRRQPGAQVRGRGEGPGLETPAGATESEQSPQTWAFPEGVVFGDRSFSPRLVASVFGSWTPVSSPGESMSWALLAVTPCRASGRQPGAEGKAAPWLARWAQRPLSGMPCAVVGGPVRGQRARAAAASPPALTRPRPLLCRGRPAGSPSPKALFVSLGSDHLICSLLSFLPFCLFLSLPTPVARLNPTKARAAVPARLICVWARCTLGLASPLPDCSHRFPAPALLTLLPRVGGDSTSSRSFLGQCVWEADTLRSRTGLPGFALASLTVERGHVSLGCRRRCSRHSVGRWHPPSAAGRTAPPALCAGRFARPCQSPGCSRRAGVQQDRPSRGRPCDEKPADTRPRSLLPATRQWACLQSFRASVSSSEMGASVVPSRVAVGQPVHGADTEHRRVCSPRAWDLPLCGGLFSFPTESVRTRRVRPKTFCG